MLEKTRVTFLLVLLATNAAAQSESSEQLDVGALRAEAQRLERDMYEIFNRLNSNDGFDVACGDTAVTGSTIPVWTCEAAYMRNSQSRNVSAARDNRWNGRTLGGTFTNAPSSNSQVAFRSRKKERELNDEMKALAHEHPELASAMIALNAAQQRLETAASQ